MPMPERRDEALILKRDLIVERRHEELSYLKVDAPVTILTIAFGLFWL